MKIYALRCGRRGRRGANGDRCDDNCSSHEYHDGGHVCRLGMMTDETVISEPLQFFVAGDPIPEGSTRAFLVKGKPRITHGNAAMDQWRQRIATEAQHASGGAWYIAKRDGTGDGVDISLEFLIPRPAGARGDAMPTKRPDVDKLERAALDALTEVLFDDDSQVLRLTGEKVYQAVGSSPGVRVTVSRRMP